MKKNASIIIYIIGVMTNIVQTILINQNIEKLTLGIMFISFTLLPMLIAFTFPLIGTVLAPKDKILYPILFCTFVYLFNYWFSDTIFTPQNIKRIYQNSGVLTDSIKVSTTVDIGNVISTAFMIYAIGFVGFYIAKVVKKRRRDLK